MVSFALNLIIPLSFLTFELSFANEQPEGQRCIVNPNGRRDIAESFHKSDETPVKKFLEVFQNSSEGVAVNRGLGPYIKESCLVASLKRVAGREGYSCARPDGSGASQNNSARRISASRQCVTSDMVRYIQSSVQNAMNCVTNASGIPIDPATTYQKINNESAFQFYQSNNGGTGLGQLTSWPLRDMFQARPRLYAETLSKVKTHPSCANFKSIVDGDTQPPGATLFPRSKICRYTSPGEGMQRNLLYSLVFMSHLKQRILQLLPRNFLEVPETEKQKRVQLVERLALVGYGPEGMAKAQGLARSIRVGNSFNVDTAIRRVNLGSRYLRATDSKSGQTIRTAGVANASACIENPIPPSEQPVLPPRSITAGERQPPPDLTSDHMRIENPDVQIRRGNPGRRLLYPRDTATDSDGVN